MGSLDSGAPDFCLFSAASRPRSDWGKYLGLGRFFPAVTFSFSSDSGGWLPGQLWNYTESRVIRCRSGPSWGPCPAPAQPCYPAWLVQSDKSSRGITLGSWPGEAASHSFIHFFFQPSIHLLLHPLIHLSLHSFIHSFIHPHLHSLTLSTVHLSILSLGHPFICPFVQSLSHPFVQSFTEHQRHA